MKKSSNISATALHRFIPQPASGRSSELSLLSFCLCLAAFLVWSIFWRLLRLHGLFFRTQNSTARIILRCCCFILLKWLNLWYKFVEKLFAYVPSVLAHSLFFFALYVFLNQQDELELVYDFQNLPYP